MFAVSKKLIPRSIARSMSSWLSPSSSTQSRQSEVPKLIQPRQIRLTSSPVLPSVVYSMYPLSTGGAEKLPSRA